MNWIAVDWGTDELRLWHRADNGAVLAAAILDKGAGLLSPDEFGPTLAALVGGWVQGPTDIVISGLDGWARPVFRPVPCAPIGLPMMRPETDLNVHIVPGLSQAKPTADLMQGQETRIAGILDVHAQFDGVVCVAGSHTKWAAISAGEVTDFRSFMTGEMFDLLARHSALRHGTTGEAIDWAGFDAELSASLARPEALAARLFAIRAEGVLSGLVPATARGRLAGLLVGAELAAAKPWWLGRDVLIVGPERHAGWYRRGLQQLGVQSRTLPDEDAVLAGLGVAHRMITTGR